MNNQLATRAPEAHVTGQPAFLPVTYGDEQLFQTPQGYLMTLDQARTAYLYDAHAMRDTYELAGSMIKSGLWKLNMDQAFTVLQTAKELGIPPTFALDNLVLINGKRCMQGSLMLALVRRAGHKIDVKKCDGEGTEVVLIRKDGTSYPASFTLADAKKAGLLGKQGPWQLYPNVMMYWRAISMVCRMGASECLGGVSYTPEDLDVHGEDLTRAGLPELGSEGPTDQSSGWTDEQAKELEALGQELKKLLSDAGEGMAYDPIATEVGKRARDPKKKPEDTISWLRRKVEDARSPKGKKAAPKAEPKPEPAPTPALGPEPEPTTPEPNAAEEDLSVPFDTDEEPTTAPQGPSADDTILAALLAKVDSPEATKDLWNNAWKWIQSTWKAQGVSNQDAGRMVSELTEKATGGQSMQDSAVKAKALEYIVREAIKLGFKG